MKTDENLAERKRFHKPHRYFNNVKKHPLQCLAEIFQTFHLDDFREEIPYWQELAMANDNSGYDDVSAREDLIDFCQEFLRLAEAIHVLNTGFRKSILKNGKRPFKKCKENDQQDEPASTIKREGNSEPTIGN